MQQPHSIPNFAQTPAAELHYDWPLSTHCLQHLTDTSKELPGRQGERPWIEMNRQETQKPMQRQKGGGDATCGRECY